VRFTKLTEAPLSPQDSTALGQKKSGPRRAIRSSIFLGKLLSVVRARHPEVYERRHDVLSMTAGIDVRERRIDDDPVAGLDVRVRRVDDLAGVVVIIVSVIMVVPILVGTGGGY
jgi:hypothetical protein